MDDCETDDAFAARQIVLLADEEEPIRIIRITGALQRLGDRTYRNYGGRIAKAVVGIVLRSTDVGVLTQAFFTLEKAALFLDRTAAGQTRMALESLGPFTKEPKLNERLQQVRSRLGEGGVP